jgi:dihydroxyacetone kinase-like protein
VMYHAARAKIEARGMTVSRSLVGNYVTALDMAGCSLTVCALDGEMAALWDAPVHTPALRWRV